MSLAVVVAAAMFAGFMAYSVFGGADFGAGFYDLTAGGARRGAELRRQVDHSIGPVWEANHVWLIFVLVTWWTGFPEAFAAGMRTLIIPLLFALLGIVLRGAAFAFRKYAASLGQARLFGALFAASSVITPFFLGTVVGAVASGRVPRSGRGDLWTCWLNPTSVFTGILAVGTCAFLAGVFLVADVARVGNTRLLRLLRTRTIAVAAVTGVCVFAALLPVRHDAPTLWEGLTGRALPLVVVAALTGVATLLLLVRNQFSWARVTAVAAVVAVVAGWGVAQYPWMLVDELRIEAAAGAHATLVGLLVAVGLAVVLVLPSLIYLFRLVQSEEWSG